MRTSKLFTATVFISAVTLLSTGFAFAAPPQSPGSNGNGPVSAATGYGDAVEKSSHRIVTKHDHQMSFTGNYGSYNWAGFSDTETVWTVKVHAKEAAHQSYSKGTVHFYGENPGGSYVDMVGQVEYAQINYPYWPSSRGDVLLLAGRTVYNDVSYNFMYLESEETVWVALSDSQSWQDRVAVNGVLTDRDFQVHSSLVPDQFDLSEKVIVSG